MFGHTVTPKIRCYRQRLVLARTLKAIRKARRMVVNPNYDKDRMYLGTILGAYAQAKMNEVM